MIRTILVAALLVAASAALAAPDAFADPCTAKLPSKEGATFTGKVRHIVDGDGFCVGISSDPKTWIEVRMADFNGPELSTPEGKRGKAILASKIAGKEVSCTTAKGRNGKTTTYDRVLARCKLGSDAISGILRAAKDPQGGN